MKKLKLLLILFLILFAIKGVSQSGKESVRAEITDNISKSGELKIGEYQNCPCQKSFDFFMETAYKNLNKYDPYWIAKPVGIEDALKTILPILLANADWVTKPVGIESVLKTIFIKGRLDKESIAENDLIWTLKYKK
ncbi:MAG: hypothetical protein Pg6B_06850 [Candidatus Azobacteroides pseudotrichonymphae]|jgi:hypothetical protein|uniref:Uncharacterized protein n=1 Tax=Azobacteroides pseudotrichonymphae genomovar. CFP2 TaxID=511995 RepID=B6YQE3_AZOPC|nr:hypothetical protein [Candidatus Azobacteroides pseudotrichonymphae]MDR0530329.1 hypothetical protein [Bacteroidales bacterium OttesenSCG-928-I14]BAG83415.1 hypothetical protein CFPG_152 [Candidatus Azobacteroides pseudotrichonymphae genomovar. CFP2]GMO35889.1 MAG: hypothetical protein Pg6B_06850 [Candidatus Azobacteroides pseudotrichonymphae]